VQVVAGNQAIGNAFQELAKRGRMRKLDFKAGLELQIAPT
jgi:hypothetical protein